MNRDYPFLPSPDLSLPSPVPRSKEVAGERIKGRKVLRVKKTLPVFLLMWLSLCSGREKQKQKQKQYKPQTTPCPTESKKPEFQNCSGYSFLNRLLEPCGPQAPDLLNGCEIFAVADLL